MHNFVTDWWIRNVFFEQWIFECEMYILNYELVEILPEVPIQKFSRFHNPECKKNKYSSSAF